MVWTQRKYTNDIDNSPVKNFLDAVEKKVGRLNSHNFDYVKMNMYELFINSFIFISHYPIDVVIEGLKVINSKLQPI